ncbi:hypothetical protein GCM10017607_15690 [Microbacterium thalassium]|nr:hypothetical protein GCM10017607_15690 [Microbacterium thalassium]
MREGRRCGGDGADEREGRRDAGEDQGLQSGGHSVGQHVTEATGVYRATDSRPTLSPGGLTCPLITRK